MDELTLESHKTKECVHLLEAFSLTAKVLVVDDRENRNLYLSSRNLAGIKMVIPLGVNVYDLVDCEHLLISKNAILELQGILDR